MPKNISYLFKVSWTFVLYALNLYFVPNVYIHPKYSVHTLLLFIIYFYYLSKKKKKQMLHTCSWEGKFHSISNERLNKEWVEKAHKGEHCQVVLSKTESHENIK